MVVRIEEPDIAGYWNMESNTAEYWNKEYGVNGHWNKESDAIARSRWKELGHEPVV